MELLTVTKVLEIVITIAITVLGVGVVFVWLTDMILRNLNTTFECGVIFMADKAWNIPVKFRDFTVEERREFPTIVVAFQSLGKEGWYLVGEIETGYFLQRKTTRLKW